MIPEQDDLMASASIQLTFGNEDKRIVGNILVVLGGIFIICFGLLFGVINGTQSTFNSATLSTLNSITNQSAIPAYITSLFSSLKSAILAATIPTLILGVITILIGVLIGRAAPNEVRMWSILAIICGIISAFMVSYIAAFSIIGGIIGFLYVVERSDEDKRIRK